MNSFNPIGCGVFGVVLLLSVIVLGRESTVTFAFMIASAIYIAGFCLEMLLGDEEN